MGTGDRTDYFKMLLRQWPRWHRCLPFAPDHRAFYRVWRTSIRLRNSNVFHPSLLNNIRNSDATTTSRSTRWLRTSTLGTEPTLTRVSGSFSPHNTLLLTWVQIGQPVGCTHPQTKTMDWFPHSQWHCQQHVQRLLAFSIATPLSEKELFCVNKESRAKSCTQVVTPSIPPRLRATRSNLMLEGAPGLLAPLTASSVNWKAWPEYWNYGNELMTRKSTLDFIYLVKMTTSLKSRLWGPGQDVPYMRATPRGDALQLLLDPHKRLIFSPNGLHSWATKTNQLH